MSDWLIGLGLEEEGPVVVEPVSDGPAAPLTEEERGSIAPPDLNVDPPTFHHATSTPIVDTKQKWSFQGVNPRRTTTERSTA